MRAYCDFDGTITTVDSTDHVLQRLALPEWRAIEQRWLCGQISAAECMRSQIALLKASDAQVDAALDEIRLSPGFPEFVRWCAANDVPLVVVSDGVDYFIQRILFRHGIFGLQVVANRLAGEPHARRLEQPWRKLECVAASGVCKCAVVQSRSVESVVVIGDGRSDFCVSRRADLLFAKADLARHAHEQDMNFMAFVDFHDVLKQLAPRLRRERRLQSTPALI